MKYVKVCRKRQKVWLLFNYPLHMACVQLFEAEEKEKMKDEEAFLIDSPYIHTYVCVRINHMERYD